MVNFSLQWTGAQSRICPCLTDHIPQVTHQEIASYAFPKDHMNIKKINSVQFNAQNSATF